MLFPKPKLVDIVSLCGYKSEVTTVEPLPFWPIHSV